MKLTKRKGFNFFRSYYDVYNELSDKDKVAFMDALLERQFQGTKPTNLEGMAKFAYISQTHSIDSQVKGYEAKHEALQRGKDTPTEPPTEGAVHGGQTPPTEGAVHGGQTPPTEQVQVEGEVKEEEEVQVKEKVKGELRLTEVKTSDVLLHDRDWETE